MHNSKGRKEMSSKSKTLSPHIPPFIQLLYVKIISPTSFQSIFPYKQWAQEHTYIYRGVPLLQVGFCCLLQSIL